MIIINSIYWLVPEPVLQTESFDTVWHVTIGMNLWFAQGQICFPQPNNIHQDISAYNLTIFQDSVRRPGTGYKIHHQSV